MAILGAHMSIAGGYYRAVEAAHAAGCDCVQIFTKNNNQWRAKPLSRDDITRFRDALERLEIGHPISHDSYLINLASPDEALWKRSVEAFRVELERAEQLGIPYVVTHPGSYTVSTEAEGLARVALALNQVHRELPRIKAQCLLEITAGQGTNLGWRFEHLAEILRQVDRQERVGVCFDTCHAFAAGYDLRTRAGYRAAMRELDGLVGLERIKAFHLNDSVRELGSRVDRHAAIGLGKLGTEAFGLLLADRRFGQVPMYLETPKGTHDGEDWDVTNLRVLRNLIPQRAGAVRRPATARPPATGERRATVRESRGRGGR